MNSNTMSLRLHSFLRRILKVHGKKFSTAVKVKDEQINTQVCSFRTIENNPFNHNANHIGRVYTIPTDIQQIFQYGGFPKEYMKQITTFQEHALIIRQPAIEIISYLNQADYSRPVNKYVLYGKFGTGKSLTLCHLLHYAFVQKYILVHVYWAANWFTYDKKDVENSIFSPGCVDLPIDAGIWLKHFKCQNSELLSQLDIKISKDYVWNQREITSQGTPIMELIEFGINRVKYACGVMDALIKELKFASTAGKCKTIVVIDGFNAFTSSHTRIRDDNKALVLPKQVSLTLPFLDITKDDWCNGAIVLTVDMKANKERRESNLPRYLLGKEGFEHLDPFVPVLVDDYSPIEFDSMVDYYKDRKWIRKITPVEQKELELITNKHPLSLMQRCKFL